MKTKSKRTVRRVGSGRLVRLLCEKCGWYGTENEVGGKQYRDGDVDQWCPKCGASDDHLTECDCQDPEHGFISMECPVHNWNPSEPNIRHEPRPTK